MDRNKFLKIMASTQYNDNVLCSSSGFMKATGVTRNDSHYKLHLRILYACIINEQLS
jgi:hypothetical protein